MSRNSSRSYSPKEGWGSTWPLYYSVVMFVIAFVPYAQLLNPFILFCLFPVWGLVFLRGMGRSNSVFLFFLIVNAALSVVMLFVYISNGIIKI